MSHEQDLPIAPSVTIEGIESKVKSAKFHRLTEVLTVCVLTLENGFFVTGESACASPENYNKALGEKYAREDAINKVWAFEGYLLKQKLYEGK